MYIPDEKRYENMIYNRCGKSGLKLSAISLGFWKNFGYENSFSNIEEMVHTAFDLGIVHFDLANNYGNPNGSAEENFGRVLDNGMKKYRDEICISTKAGYEMWEGVYGDRNGSRKYLTASLDQSLKRMNLEYVDIFYHHVPDPYTPVEETALALDNAVKQGKALYVGISNYNKKQSEEITKIFRELKTPFIINQPSYSMLNRWIEDDGLDDWASENGIGISVFSPLYQGMLTGKYINGIPKDSRIGRNDTNIGNMLDEKMISKIKALNNIAVSRGQTLAQMALSWVLNNKSVTTVLIGASRPSQIKENVESINNLSFSDDEISEIEKILSE